jgi:hypothetical protein
LADIERKVEELERRVHSLERSLRSMEEEERIERRRSEASRRTNTFMRILIYALFFAALIVMMIWAKGKLV